MNKIDFELDYLNLYLNPHLLSQDVFDRMIHMRYQFPKLDNSYEAFFRGVGFLKYNLIGYRIPGNFVWTRGWEFR